MALTRIGSVGLSTGININAGVGTFTGDLTVGGVLTYEDVTNVDSIGIITARAGVKVGSGITLSSDGDIFFTGIMTGNGSGLTGIANTDVIFADKITLPDSSAGSINVGLASDLQIYHDGANSYIKSTTNDLIIWDDTRIRFRSPQYLFNNQADDENIIVANQDGAVELYHNHSKKLETASGGVTVTGTLAATAVTGDGSGLTGIGGTDFIHAEQISTTGIVTATSFVPTVGQLSHRNIIINGAMNVAEHGTSSTDNGYKTVDRLTPYTSNIGVTPTYSQVDVTSGGAYDSGFRKAWQVTKGAGTANTNSQVNMGYKIEAQDIANSGWKYTDPSSFITFSFWVKTSVSNHNPQVLIQNSDTGTSSTKFFVIDVPTLTANTWTKITQTIPGHANQVYNNDNGTGLEIQIIPWYGTDYTDAGNTTGAWTSFGTKPVDSTWLTTNSSTFQVTGMQLEVGPVATPFEHRSFQDELLRCQRYYYAHKGPLWGEVSAGDHLDVALYFPVPMRDTPSFNQVDTSLTYKNRLNQGNSISANTYTVSGGTNKYGAMWVARPAGGESWDTSAGRIHYYHAPEGTTSYEWSAEL